MLDALTLAKYIVTKCTEEACPISNLQLQKILYYIQVEFLKRFGKPAFQDEIEAWMFGPVIRSVYNRYCGFGSMKIQDYSAVDLPCTEEEQELINQIVEQNRSLKPWDLVEATHADGKAWSRIYNDGEGNKSIIPQQMMRKYG